MDKLAVLRTAIDEILDDDRVTHEEDGTYTVRRDDGGVVRVCTFELVKWVVCFESGNIMPSSPLGDRPHELVAWALQ